MSPAPYADRNERLLAGFMQQLDADEATVIHAALLCLSGALYLFRGRRVRFQYVKADAVSPSGPRPEPHVQDLVTSFRDHIARRGTPPPPISVFNGRAADGNHRLHAARRLGILVAAFVSEGEGRVSLLRRETSARTILRKLNPTRLAQLERLEREKEKQRRGKGGK